MDGMTHHTRTANHTHPPTGWQAGTALTHKWLGLACRAAVFFSPARPSVCSLACTQVGGCVGVFILTIHVCVSVRLSVCLS